MVHMRRLFLLNGADKRAKILIPTAQKMQLIVEVFVNRRLDGRRANPNSLPTQQRGEEPKNQPAVAPQRHDAAGPRRPLRHGLPEHCAVSDFVCQRFLKERRHVAIEAARNPELGPIDSNSSILAGMIDLQDPADREPIGLFHGYLPASGPCPSNLRRQRMPQSLLAWLISACRLMCAKTRALFSCTTQRAKGNQ